MRRRFLTGAGLAVSAGVLGRPALQAQAKPDQGYDAPRGMTFATLRRDGKDGLGIKTERGILDVKKAEAALRLGAATTINEVIARGGGRALQALVAAAKTGPAELFVPEDAARFGPCVTSPDKIICVGLNYRKHAAETNQPVPETPVLFNKFITALSGHRGTIRVSQEAAKEFDYEVELVIVMGKTARNVGEAQALDSVFGYCTGNDFTARELQRRTSQWMLGKALDGSAPIGPYLVSADQIPDPNALKLECRVNGELRQSSNTADMIFNCRQIVSYISRYITLAPGDIIFTGTPEGVITGYPKEKQVWLKAGDQVRSTIEKLGELDFTLA
jgi:2-keto-4-pentenoate hydratase/2-oxohepta-3-ene-1,7-dioic acid hydratase in catechol pathway